MADDEPRGIRRPADLGSGATLRQDAPRPSGAHPKGHRPKRDGAKVNRFRSDDASVRRENLIRGAAAGRREHSSIAESDATTARRAARHGEQDALHRTCPARLNPSAEGRRIAKAARAAPSASCRPRSCAGDQQHHAAPASSVRRTGPAGPIQMNRR